MLWIPQKGKLRVEHNLGSTGAVNYGTSVVTGATASTKGSPSQLVASTGFDAYLIEIFAIELSNGSTASEGAMDLLIGAATEEVLIANLLCGYCANSSETVVPKVWMFPLYIPAGSRLAVQAASARTSYTFYVGYRIYGGDGYPPFRVGGNVTTYGMGTVPDGTSITPGSSGAEGSWVQMTASSSEDHFAFVPSFQMSGVTAAGAKNNFVDIGVGSATEEEIGDAFIFRESTTERMEGPWPYFPCFHDVPSGTRLVMRSSCSGAPSSAYNGVLHAVS